jgi:DNA repair protein RecN (Recombination protein N)
VIVAPASMRAISSRRSRASRAETEVDALFAVALLATRRWTVARMLAGATITDAARAAADALLAGEAA